MLVRSLALTTDLGLLATRGARIVDKGDYVVVETPDDPGYFFGNLLALPAAPQVGEVAYWMRRFAEELGGKPAIKHVTLIWDDPTGATGATDELVAAGFKVEVNAVMTGAPPLVAPTPVLPLRPLTPTEVRDALPDLGWTMGDRHDETYRSFLARRATWHASLVERGLARFWGAIDPVDGIVASLGLVPLGPHHRYQDVQTVPTHRNRGLAAALLVAAAAEATTPVVIVAEPTGAAARVYARVGLRTVEHVGSACRWPG